MSIRQAYVIWIQFLSIKEDGCKPGMQLLIAAWWPRAPASWRSCPVAASNSPLVTPPTAWGCCPGSSEAEIVNLITESISTITKHPHLRRLDWEYCDRQDNSFPWASQFISPDSQRILMREEQSRQVQPSLRHPDSYSLMRAAGMECWRIPPWQPWHEPEPGSWSLLTLPTTRQN